MGYALRRSHTEVVHTDYAVALREEPIAKVASDEGIVGSLRVVEKVGGS